MSKVLRCLGFAAIAVAAMSCGDVVRNSRAPVLLVLNTLLGAPGNKTSAVSGTLVSSVRTFVTSPPPCSPQSPCTTIFNDFGSAQFSIVMKDPAFQPSSSNAVTITGYHVQYTRSDGRNTPGADVPYAFDGAVTSTVGANQIITVSFEIVRHVAKEESPLIQLIDSPVVISTIAHVTFFGKDQVGNDISVMGQILIDFGDFPNS
jgi:hypothetical protein